MDWAEVDGMAGDEVGRCLESAGTLFDEWVWFDGMVAGRSWSVWALCDRSV